jgi:hypothetical protein
LLGELAAAALDGTAYVLRGVTASTTVAQIAAEC